jgi:NAD(P)-dependent dehydrogenase (short-subunit alcohol dehydrogenase family)
VARARARRARPAGGVPGPAGVPLARPARRLPDPGHWDTGTVGDPLLDIGHLLARWTEPGEEPAIGVWDIEVRDGLPSRAELAARYADRTGADLSALPYYQALALFKLAIILEGSVARLAGPGAAARAAEGGSIINISSIGSLRPGPDELVYACAKAGLNALTVGLADAFGPRVRVNAILPGAVLTDIARAWPADRLRRTSDSVPLGRAGQPADLVGTALWLASRASQWVTGVMVRVDGGMYRQTS